MPISLYALGLGEMKVQSSLDQPFSAEIELIDVGADPIASIKVNLADPEQFEQIGLERTAVLSLLRFQVERNPKGTPVVKVSSTERMTEPYMENCRRFNLAKRSIIQGLYSIIRPARISIGNYHRSKQASLLQEEIHKLQ